MSRPRPFAAAAKFALASLVTATCLCASPAARADQAADAFDAFSAAFLVQGNGNDDLAWMVTAVLRGYQITGNPSLLNVAEDTWNLAYNRGWDTTYVVVDIRLDSGRLLQNTECGHRTTARIRFTT